MMTQQAIFSSKIKKKKSGRGNVTYYVTIPINQVRAFKFLQEVIENNKEVRVIIEPLEED